MAFGLDDEFGFYDAECQGCDILTRVDDVGLCKECAAKLDRDLVRQRDWDYSAMAFGVPPEHREELRRKVIQKYGENLELIAPSKVKKPKSSAHTKWNRKRR